ncbi:autotransporter outer membrane beta-barrel domain-containing protein [Neisseria sp. Ec49-e6-T10]|uniref:autotransporter outer membrane beta-barrel domain-containing protein n=1 Tax=Neisseria sp. Ec49-e6-T10 TaxID=3140744 RepID=UPI003EBF6E5A
MKFKKNLIQANIALLIGFGVNYVYADANVPCGDGATIIGTTVFGGGWSPSNVCGNNVTIETTGSKTIGGGNETNNTNGIYYAMNGNNAPFVFGNNLRVTVKGRHVDAVRTNGTSDASGPHIISIGNNATLTAIGTSSDAINVAQSPGGGSGAGKILLGTNAVVSSEAGTAVRVNLTSQAGRYNLAYLAEDATISTKANGSNNIDTIGYAVFAGNRDNVLTNGTAQGTDVVAVIGVRANISTQGSNAYAVYANKGGVIQLQGSSNDALGVTTITTTGQGADALRAEKKITANNNYNNLGGTIELTGDTTIIVDQSLNNTFALHTLGEGSQIVSQETNFYTGLDNKLYVGTGTGVNSADKTTTVKSGKFSIKGDMLAESGLINLKMNDGSEFYGNTSLSQYTYSDGLGGSLTDAKGQIHLSISGTNSKWQMSKSSELTTLDVSGAKVYLGDQTIPINASNQVNLTMQDLKGNNGEFFVRTDIVSSDNTSLVNVSDKIIVTGTSSGNHKIFVNDQSTGSASGDEIVRVAEIADGTAQFTLSNVNGYVDMGAYKYGLVEVDPALSTAEKHWYLKAGSFPPVNPPVNPPVTPPLTETADHSINILNINYLLSNIENQTLLQRMGELRQSEGSEGDVWARAFTGKLDSFADNVAQGFDLDYTGIQIGADKLFIREQGHLYLGGMIGTTKADANYDIGDGDTKSYHAGMYLTYKGNNGFYIDGIAKYVHMKNNFTAQTGGGYKVKGGGNTSGYSVGIEAGKRFYFDQPQTGWYIEPQAQLTYSHQDSATVEASNGLKTDLDGFDSTIGRISAIIGYTLVEGNNPIDVYLKTGYMKEFDGKAGYTFNQSKTTYARYKLNGDWWDNGIGVNTQINKNHNLYMDLNYSVGNKFDKVQLNAGYRYSF